MKGIGEKVLGWFVVQEGEDGEGAAQQGEGGFAEQTEVVNNAPKKEEPVQTKRSTMPPPLPSRATATATSSGVRATSFCDVYRAKGIPDADCERLTKVMDLLASLPEEASQDVKRAIVGAALQAFGVPIDQITMTANAAIASIDAHIAEGERRTNDVITQAEARIQKLSTEINEVRRLIDLQHANQRELAIAASSERSRVESAIDFFGVPAVQYSSQPRLRDLVRLK